jgi:Mg2+ and Co2+ transporter CorA
VVEGEEMSDKSWERVREALGRHNGFTIGEDWVPAADVVDALDTLRTRMEQLEQENKRLRRTTIEMTNEDVTVARMEELEAELAKTREERDALSRLIGDYDPAAFLSARVSTKLTQLEAELAKTRDVVNAARGFVGAWERNAKATVRMKHRLALTDALATLDQQTQGDTDHE